MNHKKKGQKAVVRCGIAVIKRGYYFPPDIAEYWEKFHFPTKNYSPSAVGAFMVWTALDAVTREKIIKLAYTHKPEAAVKKIAKLIGV